MHRDTNTYEQFLQLTAGLDFLVFVRVGLRFVCFTIFIPVLFAFVALGLVPSVLRQEIGREECPRNDLFCVKWDVKS